MSLGEFAAFEGENASAVADSENRLVALSTKQAVFVLATASIVKPATE